MKVSIIWVSLVKGDTCDQAHFFFNFILLYNTVLVLPYIDMIQSYSQLKGKQTGIQKIEKVLSHTANKG